MSDPGSAPLDPLQGGPELRRLQSPGLPDFAMPMEGAQSYLEVQSSYNQAIYVDINHVQAPLESWPGYNWIISTDVVW